MSQALQLNERCTNTERELTGVPTRAARVGLWCDPVQGPLQSTSNVQINWFIESTTFKSKLSISHRAPGRYSSRFRICVAFVQWLYLIKAKLNQGRSFHRALKELISEAGQYLLQSRRHNRLHTGG